MAITRPQLPRYYQIEQAILEQIQKKLIQPGAQLPSEAELAQQYQVSRITAKRALDDLVHQGWAFRQQGRGTFVAQGRIREISGFRSFSEDIQARGLIPSSRVLFFKEVEPDTTTLEKLHLLENERAYMLKRLRLADDDPVAVEVAYIPCKLCPDLLSEDLSAGSLFSVLKTKYGLVPTWADAEIEAAEATKEEAKLLGIKVGKPVLIARRVTFSANYDVIESVYSIYRGDRFTLYTGRQHID
jgi:GntR family transcriptional regulator